MTTTIEWTDATWNPIVGCSRVSKGCEHCYAERVAHRGLAEQHRGLTVMGKHGPKWNGTVRFLPDRLAEPLSWRKPRRVFVNSVSDLFHERVSFEEVAQIFAVMAATPLHTYQVLTKRPEHAAEVLTDFGWWEQVIGRRRGISGRHGLTSDGFEAWAERVRAARALPNVWLGVSVEDQATADERIPLLLETPAAIRWVSYEPALGPVDFSPWLDHWRCKRCRVERPRDGFATRFGKIECGFCMQMGGLVDQLERMPRLDWIVVGGESGPGARPFDLAWARSTIRRARAAGVPVFFKQAGTGRALHTDLGRGLHCRDSDSDRYVLLRDRKGGDTEEWPEDLRVREWPEVLP